MTRTALAVAPLAPEAASVANLPMLPAPRRNPVLTGILWVVTAALFGVFGVGCVTHNAMGGFVNGFLIAGAVMVFVTVFLGQPRISSFQPPTRNSK